MTLPIPAAALDHHLAFLGKTGSGKTSTAKLAVEQIVARRPDARVCVLDPIKSDWWGLTSSADGKKPGLPFYILGGPRGHVPLHESAGKVIGELVASGALPLSIIDMADFEPGGLQKFFNDFAPALMQRMRGVVYLVIEEAHEFAPKERSGIGAENMAIHWAKKLATAGRSKGIRMMVVTQRTQALHNALLGSCDTMIAHRLTAPADQEPVKKWLKANVSKEIFETGLDVARRAQDRLGLDLLGGGAGRRAGARFRRSDLRQFGDADRRRSEPRDQDGAGRPGQAARHHRRPPSRKPRRTTRRRSARKSLGSTPIWQRSRRRPPPIRLRSRRLIATDSSAVSRRDLRMPSHRRVSHSKRTGT